MTVLNHREEKYEIIFRSEIDENLRCAPIHVIYDL